mgnify:CR=1 FL=1
MKKYFVTGIGTGVGKTFVSAILTEALEADYWKPVQSGSIEGTDTQRVKDLVTNPTSAFHEEVYCFKDPVSPHMAAERENVRITLEYFVLPKTQRTLIIEGAGGILVPLNENSYVIDLASGFETEVILVVGSYLGCINHSILSMEYLLSNGYNGKGMILNGKFDTEVRRSIIWYSEIPVLAELPHITDVSKESISHLAKSIDKSLF